MHPHLALTFLVLVVLAAGCGPTCDVGETWDGEGCVPEVCGHAPWGDARGDLYVDLAAERGGDGSAKAPLSDLEEALGRGGVVVLAEGDWPHAEIEVPGTALVGRCAELVHLESARSGVGVRLVDVSLGGLIAFNGVMSGERLRVSGNGIQVVEGADAVLSDMEVRDTTGEAVRVVQSTLDLRDALVTGATGAGIDATRAELFLARVRVEDTLPDGERTGEGIRLLHGGAYAEDLSVVRSGYAGVSASGQHELELVGCEVVDTLGTEAAFGTGILVSGYSGRISDCVVSGSRGVGIAALGDLELEHVSVLDTTGGPLGPGIGIYAKSFLPVHRVHVAGAELAGVYAHGGHMSGAFVTVEDVWAAPGSVGGRAVESTTAGGMWCSRCTLRRAGEAGVVSGGGAVLVDSVVEEIGDGSAPALGVAVRDWSELSLVRTTIRDVRGPGVYSEEGKLRGSGGDVEVEDSLVRGVQFAGVWHQGDEAALDGLVVEDVALDPGLGGGVGVYLGRDSRVEVESMAVRGAPLAGLWLDDIDEPPRLRGLDIEGGQGVLYEGKRVHGDGIVVLPDTGGLVLDHPSVAGATGAGLLLHGTTAQVIDGSWSDNAVDVVQQHCSEDLANPEGVSDLDTVLCPQIERLVLDLEYVVDLWEVELEY